MIIDLLIKEVNKIENKDLSIFEFDDTNWWPLVRVYLFQNHKTEKQKESQNNPVRDELFYFKRILWDVRLRNQTSSIFKQIKNKNTYSNLSQTNTCFITSEANYKQNSHGKLINRYLDPLFLEFDKSKLLFVRSNKADQDYVVDKVVATNYFELKYVLKNQFNAIIKTILFQKPEPTYSFKHKIEIENIINYLKSYKYFENFNFSHLSSWINKTKQSEAVANFIFDAIHPKILIQYCYYFPLQFGYTLAANKRGIKTVDYQHGIQNKFHYAYGSWANVPNTGYQLLPSEFWVYSNHEEKNLLNSFLNTTHIVKVIGNAWVNYWNNNKTSEEKLSWVYQLKQKHACLVLFTVSNHVLDSEHFFWNFLKDCNNDKIYFLFRLHPGYLQLKDVLISTLKEINFLNYNIEQATITELYDLLYECNIHITQNSTVAEEALYFNKSTILIDKKWELYFENYILNNDMFVAHNESDLKQLINHQLSKQ